MALIWTCSPPASNSETMPWAAGGRGKRVTPRRCVHLQPSRRGHSSGALGPDEGRHEDLAQHQIGSVDVPTEAFSPSLISRPWVTRSTFISDNNAVGLEPRSNHAPAPSGSIMRSVPNVVSRCNAITSMVAQIFVDAAPTPDELPSRIAEPHAADCPDEEPYAKAGIGRLHGTARRWHADAEIKCCRVDRPTSGAQWHCCLEPLQSSGSHYAGSVIL